MLDAMLHRTYTKPKPMQSLLRLTALSLTYHHGVDRSPFNRRPPPTAKCPIGPKYAPKQAPIAPVVAFYRRGSYQPCDIGVPVSCFGASAL